MTLPLPPLQEPDIIRTIRQFRDGLFYMEQVQTQVMVAQWLRMETMLAGEMDALALEIEALRQAGVNLPKSKIIRLERYRRLVAQIRVEMSRYLDLAAEQIAAQQRLLLELGLSQSSEILRTLLAGQGLYSGFDVLPVDALATMIGLAGDGSPLRKLLQASFPDSVEGLTAALIDAILKGTNPRETARLMKNGFGVGLKRALNIARTEQLRAYREASRLNYERSGVVRGYRRLSARDSRVCPACLMADDGTVYPLEAPFEEHPSGRCALVPALLNLPDVRWQSGPEWFLTISESAQAAILGPGRFEAWQAGQYVLAQ
ncbi:MAG TPA: hypothetical protein VF982_09990, partial [Anaerolineales bacterium]